MSAIALDPLIAEAKERARRRRLLALCALVVVAAAIATPLATRSSGNTHGICAAVPAGFKERHMTNRVLGPPTLVLTNFRFGRMDYLYGISDPRLHFPPGGVVVAISNVAATKASDSGTLRVLGRNFNGIEGGTQGPSTQVSVVSHGRVVTAEVEVGKLTPATVAAANRALAGVPICSA